jgi:hypothetical protein
MLEQVMLQIGWTLTWLHRQFIWRVGWDLEFWPDYQVHIITNTPNISQNKICSFLIWFLCRLNLLMEFMLFCWDYYVLMSGLWCPPHFPYEMVFSFVPPPSPRSLFDSSFLMFAFICICCRILVSYWLYE